MNRREWMKTSAAAGAALAFGGVAEASYDQATAVNVIETKVLRLNTRHTWTTTMSSSAYRDTLHLKWTRDGVTGTGEGAPIVRYHEDAIGGQKAIESIRELLTTANPW